MYKREIEFYIMKNGIHIPMELGWKKLIRTIY